MQIRDEMAQNPTASIRREFRTISRIEGPSMHEYSAARSKMEHKIGSLERTQGDHELQRLVPLLTDEELVAACRLIHEFETEEISCETLDLELDILFDRYREVKVNLDEHTLA
jgi:hypothetical protein